MAIDAHKACKFELATHRLELIAIADYAFTIAVIRKFFKKTQIKFRKMHEVYISVDSTLQII